MAQKNFGIMNHVNPLKLYDINKNNACTNKAAKRGPCYACRYPSVSVKVLGDPGWRHQLKHCRVTGPLWGESTGEFTWLQRIFVATMHWNQIPFCWPGDLIQDKRWPVKFNRISMIDYKHILPAIQIRTCSMCGYRSREITMNLNAEYIRVPL